MNAKADRNIIPIEHSLDVAAQKINIVECLLFAVGDKLTTDTDTYSIDNIDTFITVVSGYVYDLKKLIGEIKETYNAKAAK